MAQGLHMSKSGPALSTDCTKVYRGCLRHYVTDSLEWGGGDMGQDQLNEVAITNTTCYTTTILNISRPSEAKND